jgi:hypothetical protein
LELVDDKKPEHQTSTIVDVVSDDTIVNDGETEKYYE